MSEPRRKRKEQPTEHKPQEMATPMGREAEKSSSNRAAGRGRNGLIWWEQSEWNLNLNPTPVVTRWPKANYLTSDPQPFHIEVENNRCSVREAVTLHGDQHSTGFVAEKKGVGGWRLVGESKQVSEEQRSQA